MRTAFIEQLIIEARSNSRIFLLVGDLGYSVVEPFAREFPERFLNVGVAEQNMMGIAAGLAMENHTVFVYSIANFPTLRCMEQIRYDVCYHNLDVKIVAVGAGYAYAGLGPSHHATEDIAMLRSIPGLSVVSPGDPLEAKKLTAWLCNTPGPGYIRLGKAGESNVHENDFILEGGRPVLVIPGEKTAVFATGSIIKYASETIVAGGKNHALFSFPFIKPLDRGKLVELFVQFDTIITIEEHQLSGGFGSAILEAASDLYEQGAISTFPKIKRIGIRDEFVSVAGSQEYIRQVAGIVLP